MQKIVPPAPLLPTESERLKALRRYRILDTDREPAFDDITRIAALVCQAPIAVINLIDEGRQWFKSEIGLGVRETPLDTSICAHAILEPGIFIVRDTREDPRFNCNPLVIGEPHLRFYAGALLQTSDGHALGTVCVLDHRPRDLTDEQKATLLALARQAMALIELRSALAVADRLNQYRSQMMAVAGHDLKQPLQIVMAVLDRLQDRLSDREDSRMLAHASKAVDVLVEDLDRLALASRLDDPGAPKPIEFPVEHVLATMSDNWTRHAERKGLTLQIIRSGAVIRSDPAMLTTIIGNLVGNAIKYTKSGGAVVQCKAQDKMLSIEVADTGIGIPADKLDDIFRGFLQLDGSQPEGLGLGLTIVKRTADLLGHAVTVTSEPGKGSRFAVEVPIAKR